MTVEWLQDAAAWVVSLWGLVLAIIGPALVALWALWIVRADENGYDD
jgi:hypothetical protein